MDTVHWTGWFTWMVEISIWTFRVSIIYIKNVYEDRMNDADMDGEISIVVR